MLSDLPLALLVLAVELPLWLCFPGVVPTSIVCITCGLCCLGCLVLVAFFHHTVTVVFNRPPRLTHLSAIYTFLHLTKPLQIVWRLVTAPLRVAPDVYILGEVRCGTTTLATHLAAYPGAQGTSEADRLRTLTDCAR